MNALDSFYADLQEPNKGCLLALKSIILSYHETIEHRWYYRLPCFMYQNQIFCYLWVDKKTQHPYIAIGKGVKIDHPDLVQGNRTFVKLLMFDPNRDIPVNKINEVFALAMELY